MNWGCHNRYYKNLTIRDYFEYLHATKVKIFEVMNKLLNSKNFSRLNQDILEYLNRSIIIEEN